MKLQKVGSQGGRGGPSIAHKWRRISSIEQTPVVNTFRTTRRMIFKSKLLPLLVLSLGTSSVGHGDHDKDQMPLDYVRFPYEGAYPGDDSGQSMLSPRACAHAHRITDDFRISHCRRCLCRYNHVCEIAVGPVPHQGEERSVRHCVPRCSLCKSSLSLHSAYNR